MKIIMHISDIHFGKINYDALNGITEAAKKLNPDVIVISGDLTQRARSRQFKEAAEFLKKLNHKKIIVPGNHDVPLFDIFRRFLFPLRRYKKFITEDLEPFYSDDEIVIMGINTARSFTWKNGRISLEQMSRMEDLMCPVDNRKIKIIVTHHPFIPPPGDAGIELVGRSVKALEIIDKCFIDLLLAGHLHQGYSGDVRRYYPGRKRSVISIQAGTSASSRVRNQQNAFNIISFDEGKIKIEINILRGKVFEPSSSVFYKKEDGSWKKYD